MKKMWLKYVSVVFFLFFGQGLAAQIVTTFAGNGIHGYAGDGGNATMANLKSPRGIAIDNSGNIFIADPGTHCIRKVNAGGIISTVAGNGTAGYAGDGGDATNAKLNTPQGVWVDATSNIFITDDLNDVIRKVSPIGIISTIAGSGVIGYSGDGGPATAAKLNGPTGIVADEGGNIYFVEQLNHVVRKVAPSGIISTIAGTGLAGYAGDGGHATNARLHDPRGVALDASGNLYIADYTNHVIRKVSPGGIITTVAGNGIADSVGDGGGAATASLDHPSSVYISSSGDILIADSYNNRIRKVNSLGIITTVAGNGYGAGTATGSYSGDGGMATAAGLYLPIAIFADNFNNLYIGDLGNHVIRKVSNLKAGVNEAEKEDEVLLYPNPAIEELVIEVPDAVKNISVTNILAQIVYNNDYNSNRVLIDISCLPNGVYFVRINNTIVRKFVKDE